MLTLNVVMLPALADAVNVSVAETELPAATTVPSRFQVSVKYVLAFEGTQFVVVMLNVTGTVPVFLTYTVAVVEAPGANVPQLMLVQVWVQATSL
jgi:hypothetical protein